MKNDIMANMLQLTDKRNVPVVGNYVTHFIHWLSNILVWS